MKDEQSISPEEKKKKRELIMVKISLLCLFLIAMILVLTFYFEPEQPAGQSKENVGSADYLLYLLPDLQPPSYFKDERTGICFAGFIEPTIRQQLLITTVPCEKVEKFLTPTPFSLKTSNPLSSSPVSE